MPENGDAESESYSMASGNRTSKEDEDEQVEITYLLYFTRCKRRRKASAVVYDKWGASPEEAESRVLDWSADGFASSMSHSF